MDHFDLEKHETQGFQEALLNNSYRHGKQLQSLFTALIFTSLGFLGFSYLSVPNYEAGVFLGGAAAKASQVCCDIAVRSCDASKRSKAHKGTAIHAGQLPLYSTIALSYTLMSQLVVRKPCNQK